MNNTDVKHSAQRDAAKQSIGYTSKVISPMAAYIGRSRYFISGSPDETIRVWGIERDQAAVAGETHAIATSPDGW